MKPTPKEAVEVLKILNRRYPEKADMDMDTTEDTILGVLLSARTTDKQVLKLFPAFRKKFPNWKTLASANIKDIEKSLNTIGLYKNKSKAVKGLAQKILADFNGKVPSTMEELVTLPGVGRKTASCVLSYCFHVPAIAVDTHVHRITKRLGWTTKNTPVKIEQDLRKLVPETSWNDINHTMVRFGREICKPGRPLCWKCPIAKWCAYPAKTPEPKE